MIIPAHRVYLGEAGQGDTFFTVLPPAESPSVVPEVLSAGVNTVSFGWLAFSLGLAAWWLMRGPKAKARRGQIKRAKVRVRQADRQRAAARSQLKQARSLPRFGFFA